MGRARSDALAAAQISKQQAEEHDKAKAQVLSELQAERSRSAALESGRNADLERIRNEAVEEMERLRQEAAFEKSRTRAEVESQARAEIHRITENAEVQATAMAQELSAAKVDMMRAADAMRSLTSTSNVAAA